MPISRIYTVGYLLSCCIGRGLNRKAFGWHLFAMFQVIAADINSMELVSLHVLQPEMAFQSLVLFHIQIPVLPRKENGRMGLFNCSRILGVGEVGNMTPINLTRKLFSCWLNLEAIQ